MSSEKQVPSKDIIESIFKNPSTLAILAEIMMQLRITAQDLLEIKTIDIKKSVLYQRLNELEEFNFVKSKKEIENVGDRKYTKKFYYPNFERFAQFSTDIDAMKIDDPRTPKLFILYSIQALIQREIKKYLSLSDNQAKKYMRNIYPSPILDLEDIELVQQVNSKMKDLVTFILSEKAKKKKIIKNELLGDSINRPKFFTFTFFDYSKELEKIISETNKLKQS